MAGAPASDALLALPSPERHDGNNLMPEASPEANPPQHSVAQTAGNAARAVAHSVTSTVNHAMRSAPERDPEPRWPALLALFAIGGLRLALPDSLAVGPNWLVLAVIAGLTVPTVIARRMSNHTMNQVLGYITNGVITLDMAWSLCLLVAALPAHKESPGELLRSAAALWRLRRMVLAPGRRRPQRARPARSSPRWGVSLSPDDARSRHTARYGRGRMESRLRRLPFHRL